MPTRAQLRQALGKETAGGLFITGAPSSITSTTLTLAAAAHSGLDNSALLGRWLYNPTTGEERQIVSYTASSGAMTVHRAWGTNPTGSDTLEVHRWPIANVIHQGINDGLRRCKYLQSDDITPSTGVSDYSLASYTSITHPRQVVAVRFVHSSGDYEREEDVRYWQVRQDGTALTLWIDPAPYTTTGLVIRMISKVGYGPYSDESTNIAIDEDWARAAARVGMYKIIVQQQSPGKEVSRYQKLLEDAMRDFRRYSTLNQPKVTTKVRFGTPMKQYMWPGRGVSYWG